MPTKNRETQRRWSREHYGRHKDNYVARVVVRREEIRAFIRSLKDSRVCERCGFDNPIALDFHHRDSAEKDRGLSFAAVRGWSHKRILAEMTKCDLICANCHRIEHCQVS